MKVGFTGTQDGMTLAQRAACWNILDDLVPDEFHHGLCIGADEEAHGLVLQFPSCEVHGHPPLNMSKMAKCQCDVLHAPKEYLVRNRDIVDATERLIATPKGAEELRSGTWSTVRYARTLGRRLYIVMPDGKVETQ